MAFTSVYYAVAANHYIKPPGRVLRLKRSSLIPLSSPAKSADASGTPQVARQHGLHSSLTAPLGEWGRFTAVFSCILTPAARAYQRRQVWAFGDGHGKACKPRKQVRLDSQSPRTP